MTINGQVYDFAHLEPFTFTVHSVRSGRDLRIRVTFSNHCFTRGHDEVTDPRGIPIIRDGRRLRVFCAVRYRLSFKLRVVIEGLQASSARVHETSAGRNWCYSLRVEDPDGPYHIFFEVRRAGAEQRQWQELNLVVESAYHQGDRAGPALRGHMPFVLLCSKVYLGLRTATRR